MSRQTPVFIVCSPRTRVGKTLVARLLVDYCKTEGRPVAAFDANPENFALAEHLPADTAIASLHDVRGEMALFDQLVAGDGTAKVIDLGAGLFDRFFAVAQDIDLLGEAHRCGIAPVALYLVDADPRSNQGYRVLRERLPRLALIPVVNTALPGLRSGATSLPAAPGGEPPLEIPRLSPVVRGVVERPSFSFSAYMTGDVDRTTELYAWTRQMFVQFREIELRMLLANLQPSLDAELRRLVQER